MAKDDKPPVVSATDVKQADKRDAGAYERGAKAGQQKNPEDGNPYPEGSSGAKSFEHGQLDAQKSEAATNRREDRRLRSMRPISPSHWRLVCQYSSKGVA